MPSLGQISWLNKNIDNATVEAAKSLFKLIFGDDCGQLNRKKLKSFTGFNLDPISLKKKIALVSKKICFCKLKLISELLRVKGSRVGKTMARQICVLLNDTTNLYKNKLSVKYKKLNNSKEHLKKFRMDDRNDNVKGINLSQNVDNYHSEDGFSHFRTFNHFGLVCPKLPQSSNGSRAAVQLGYTTEIKLDILEYALNAVLDTGSPISFIKYSLIPETVKLQKHDNNFEFKGINGTKVEIVGCLKQKIATHGYETILNFYVVPDITVNTNCLLGRDFISKVGLVIEPLNSEVMFYQTDKKY